MGAFFVAGVHPGNGLCSVGNNQADKKHFQSRRDKSTGILIGIIIVFITCHALR